MNKFKLLKILMVVVLVSFCSACSYLDDSSKALTAATATIAARDKALTEATATIAARDKALTEATATIAARDTTISARDALIAEKEKIIASKSNCGPAVIKGKILKPKVKQTPLVKKMPPQDTPPRITWKKKPALCKGGECSSGNIWNPKDPRQPPAGKVSKRNY